MHLYRYFDISESADLDTFQRRLVEFSGDFGFGLVNACVVLDRPDGDSTFIVVGNTPAEWESRSSDSARTRRDPVMKALKAGSIPFAYDRDTYVRARAGELWEEQGVFGYQTGLAVALHLRNHKHFLLGVDRPDPLPADRDRLTSMLASVQLFAVHAQDAALRLMGLQSPLQGAPELTDRELEILRWTRDGKSAWALGRIMSVSEDTINFHLRKIFAKFGVASKHQAVLKAIGFGLL